MMNLKKFLIIHTWGIGDLIMLTPALKVLRDNFPEANIDLFVSQPGAGEVLNENSIVDRIFKFKWKKESFFSKLRFLLDLRKRKYDVAFVSGGTNPAKAGLLVFLTGAKKKIIEEKPDPSCHKIQSNLKLLERLGIKNAEAVRPFSEFKKKESVLKGRPLIAFHPGAGGNQKFKIWPKDHFCRLGRKILESFPEAHLLLVGGPQEQELCQEIKDKIGGRVSLAVGLPLKEVAGLIDNCRVFVSSDSGLAHLASTTSVASIVIFGPTDPRRTGPVGEKVKIIQGHCAYPYNDASTSKYDNQRPHRCLVEISPEIIFQEIQKFL